MMFNRRCLLLAVLILALASIACSGSILLKPKGSQSLSLTAKSVKAVVAIDRQIAVTDLELVFYNELNYTIEADFLYKLPQGAVVTEFAYWYGKEKVLARVVEKRRAAQIYQHITSRMRDPALVEMLGDNSFRARIFPVMPRDDLKIQIKYVQALRSDREGIVYTLPLSEAVIKDAKLGSVDVKINVKKSALISRVINNMGLPVDAERDSWKVGFSGANYRPQKDMVVRMQTMPQQLRSVLYSARSGGADGFFALALSPNQTIIDAAVKIAGISTYDISPVNFSSITAGKSVFIYGRYRGSGIAEVKLTGKNAAGKLAYSKQVDFSSQSIANNPASKLWAAGRIAALSKSSKNAQTVKALSMRYTIPSKFTSWLAIPKEERERFQREIKAAELDNVASSLAGLILRDKANSAEGKALRKRYNQLAKENGNRTDYPLRGFIDQELGKMGERYADLAADGKLNSSEAKHIKQVYKKHSRGTYAPKLVNSIQIKIHQLSYQIGEEGVKKHPDRKKQAVMQTKLNRLAKINKVNVKPIIKQYRDSATSQAQYELLDKAFTEAKKSNDHRRMLQIKSQLEEFNIRMHGRDYAEMFNDYYDWNMVYADMTQAHVNGIPYEGSKIDRKSLDEYRDSFKPQWKWYVRFGDPLIQVEAPADAQQVVAILPGGQVKNLVYNSDTGKWEARFDVPLHSKETSYEIQVIIVFKDGTRKLIRMSYKVDITAPQGKAEANLSRSGKLALQIDTDPNTARVSAILPWQQKVELVGSSSSGRFFRSVDIPSKYLGESFEVVFVLTDSAHNRATIKVQTSGGQGE